MSYEVVWSAPSGVNHRAVDADNVVFDGPFVRFYVGKQLVFVVSSNLLSHFRKQ